ncbi:MAG: hypothetical protein K2Y05_08250 [Hyphomicrobiaceae bacterium]|nr:hypothetical protein [Hyphomicrobiaceae bacterium]
MSRFDTKVEQNMCEGPKKRIEVIVPRSHVPAIRSCLLPFDYADFNIRPVIAGWTTGGYWSSERSFERIGDQVMVSFAIDPTIIAPLIASGFGILSGEIVKLSVSDLPLAA